MNTYSFVTDFDVISLCQFGFQRGKWTYQAVTRLTVQLFDIINSKKIALHIFIDFSKAFDTVKHSILIKNSFKSVVNRACPSHC